MFAKLFALLALHLHGIYIPVKAIGCFGPPEPEVHLPTPIDCKRNPGLCK